MKPDFGGSPRFDIRREIGAGAMGVVYEAFDRDRQTTVAIKSLQRLDADYLLLFKNEFRSLQGIHHRNLVRLGEMFQQGGQWFFTMELVRGRDFRAFVSIDRPQPRVEVTRTRTTTETASSGAAGWGTDEEPELLPVSHRFREAELRDALAQLADGLHALHQAGRVHRDVKPGNVMVTDEGRLVLLDFGLIRPPGRGPWDTDGVQPVMGTPSYMAPEQAAGEPASTASDIYSAGVMLYEALTGYKPFRGTTLQVLTDKQFRDPMPPSSLVAELPRDLEELCVSMLSRRPAERPTARELLAIFGVGESGARPRRDELVLVARDELLGALHERFDARAAGVAPVLVHGSSGMGKTILIEQLTRQLRERHNAVVLSGRCYERESVPYKAFDGIVDELSHYLGTLPDRERPTVAASLGRLFPVLDPFAEDADEEAGIARDPSELRRRAFAALKALLVRVAERRPLALVIDDLQWGDLDSGMLLAEILGPPSAPPLLFIGVYRTEEASGPLIALLESELERAYGNDRLAVIEVGPLSPAGTRELARQVLEQPTEDLVRMISAEAGGNPYFVTELARHQNRRDRSPQRITVEALFERRRVDLEPEARRLLELIAVASRPIQQRLALAASGASADALDHLRAETLIRTRGPGPEDPVETYHDRIREAPLATLAAEELRAHHAALVDALESGGVHQVEMLAEHSFGAGDHTRTRRYAMRAAEHAEKVLAFDRAARMYELVLGTVAGGGAERMDLLTRLGSAYARAGRGADAAEAYLDAASRGSGHTALDLRRRAAEQLLRSGRVDEGQEVLAEVLAACGVSVPDSSMRAMASLLLRRGQLRLRGLRFDNRAVPSEREREQLDSLWTASIGLGMVDPVRGADFSTRCLLRALTLGDRPSIAKCLAIESVHVAAGGGKTANRALALARRATELADRVGDPHGRGLAAFGRGAIALLSGRFTEAQRECDQAESIYRDQCTGVAWEIATVRTFHLTALYYLGEWNEMHERAATAVRQALERGDLYTAAGLASFATYARLALDDVEGARRQVHHATVRWSVSGYHLQHYLELISNVQIDLYEGAGASAWARMERQWSRLSRSLLFRLQLLRVEVPHARARCALALACSRGAAACESQLRTAVSDAKRIASEKMPWSDPLAALVRAGVEACRGRIEPAARLLDQAERALEAQRMRFFAAAARRHRGRIIGGDTGRALVEEADALMASQSVVNPAGVARMLVPGFDRI